MFGFLFFRIQKFLFRLILNNLTNKHVPWKLSCSSHPHKYFTCFHIFVDAARSIWLLFIQCQFAKTKIDYHYPCFSRFFSLSIFQILKSVLTAMVWIVVRIYSIEHSHSLFTQLSLNHVCSIWNSSRTAHRPQPQKSAKYYYHYCYYYWLCVSNFPFRVSRVSSRSIWNDARNASTPASAREPYCISCLIELHTSHILVVPFLLLGRQKSFFT